VNPPAPASASAPPQSGPTADLLGTLLRDVSRSFYLTLQLLPREVRRPISLGYLLARATDTIADTEVLPVTDRLQALDQLRARILGERHGPVDFTALINAQILTPAPHPSRREASPGGTTAAEMHRSRGEAPPPEPSSQAERVLLEQTERAIGLLDTLTPADRTHVREVLRTITGGQVLDLQRFGAATVAEPVALAHQGELDDYTYRVAGCVGEFWTRVCRSHLFPEHPIAESVLIADGIRFGQGLQLVNILRDLPKDLRQGRCYLPADRLAGLQLQPRDLLDPAMEPRLRPLYQELLQLADDHLAAGWRYTCSLPANQRRLRLGCALPILIGWQTLARLRAGNVLDSRQRIKINRSAVRGILAQCIWRLPFPGAWRRLPRRYQPRR